MEHHHGGLADDFPFQLGDFWFHVSLPGCMIIELLAEIIFFKVFVTE